MDEKEKEYHRKRLVLLYERTKNEFDAFDSKDIKLVVNDLISYKDREKKGVNILDSWIDVKNSKASKQQKEHVKKFRKQIPDFDKMMQTYSQFLKLNRLFLFHKSGADFLEAASVIGKHLDGRYGKEEMDKDFKILLRNKTRIN